MSDKEILESVSEHTGELRAAAWLKNILRNKEYPGFTRTVKELKGIHRYRKAVVIAAGPGFKRFGLGDLELLKKHPEVIRVACDGALPTLGQARLMPHYVVSVDAHPVVANFYRRFFVFASGLTEGDYPGTYDEKREPITPRFLLSTTIHRDVVEEVFNRRQSIFWWQSFSKDKAELPAWTGGGSPEKFFQEGVPVIQTGGNVGTTSLIIARFLLGCTRVGLLGLEFAWSDETPLMSTQYYGELMKILGGDEDRVKQHFKRVYNKRDGQWYVADPVYYAYLIAFRRLWGLLKPEERASIFNLTKQGILSADGLKTISVDKFLKTWKPVWVLR